MLKNAYATEYNPSETIKTNIIGAMNVIDAAVELGVNSHQHVQS
jgi:UDP-N-acetylglucosamine 4,6-dehydratase